MRRLGAAQAPGEGHLTRINDILTNLMEADGGLELINIRPAE